MIKYLLICYVDTERVSHNQSIVQEIIDLINDADIVACEYTLLFKIGDLEITSDDVIENVQDFFNDPAGIYDEYDEEEEEDEEEEDASPYHYERDYLSLYIQFVSSKKLFDTFVYASKNLATHQDDEYHCISFDLSCLDQMEILRKLQQPETDSDLLKKAIKFKGEKHEQSLRKIYDRYKN